MTLYDYLFNTPAWQRSAYVVTGLAIVGVLALGARVAISLRRRVPHYRALWLPIIVATIAIVFYTEAFLLGGMWATREDPAVREHIATVGWLWSALEAFTFPPWLHIKVALFTGLLTTVSVVSVLSSWWRVVVGAVVGFASTLLFEVLAIAYTFSSFVQSREIQFFGIVAPLVGAVVSLVSIGVDLVLVSARGRWWLRATTLGALLILMFGGVAWALMRPFNERVVVLADEWEQMKITPSVQSWGTGEEKISAKPKWLRFHLTSDGMSMEVGTVLSPRWQPTRLEIRRVPLEEPGHAVRRVTPFSVLPGVAVYTNEIPLPPNLRFRGPSRACVMVGKSALQGGAEIDLSLPRQKRIQLTPLGPEQTEWPEKEQQTSRPRTMTIQFLDGLGTMTMRAEGHGVWSLFCYAAVRFDTGPVFGLENDDPVAETANAQFEPKRFGKVLKFATHPPVVISAGRPNEGYEVKLSAKVTQVTFELDALRLGSAAPREGAGIGVKDVELRSPSGTLEIGRTRHPLEPTDDVSLGGEQFRASRMSSGTVRIEGRSSRVVVNDEVLSRSLWGSLPEWLQGRLFDLLILICTNLVSFFVARRLYRRNPTSGS